MDLALRPMPERGVRWEGLRGEILGLGKQKGGWKIKDEVFFPSFPPRLALTCACAY